MTHRPGQTIIEMLIALAVISVGLFAAVNIVYSNLNLVDRDTDEAIVVNLAREGVEIAKQVRDSNWLASAAFTQGLSAGNDYSATVVWDGSVGTIPSFDFTANATSDADARIVLKDDFFAQSGASGTSTPFARLVTLHPVCTDFSVLNDGSACAPANPQIGIRVESRVSWTRKNIAKSTVIYDDLYDWR